MDSTAVPLNSTFIKSGFTDSTHTMIGLYLFFIGLIGTFTNSLVLTTFYRFRQLISPTALLLINLTIADMGVLGILFPFSSSSSFANRWLYGDRGCQAYAFMGFLAGSCHIGTLTLLALDRYNISCQKSTKFRDKYNYFRNIAGVWMYSLFWATMPLIGWGRYSFDNSISACTIDWRNNDNSYKSFIIFYFLFGFLIPLFIIIFCYYSIIKRVKDGSVKSGNAKINGEDVWVKEKTVTLMSITIIIVFVFSWSPYAVLCLWTVFYDPISVPFWLSLIPPLFAKTSTLFNPIIYYLTNNRLRGAFLSSVFCREISHPAISDSQGRIVRFNDSDKEQIDLN